MMTDIDPKKLDEQMEIFERFSHPQPEKQVLERINLSVGSALRARRRAPVVLTLAGVGVAAAAALLVLYLTGGFSGPVNGESQKLAALERSVDQFVQAADSSQLAAMTSDLDEDTLIDALEAAEPPLAIFAGNAYGAWGAVTACRELGLAIPDDVALACFDNSDVVQALAPPITAIAHRTVEVGNKAVELLDQLDTDSLYATLKENGVTIDAIPSNPAVVVQE